MNHKFLRDIISCRFMQVICTLLLIGNSILLLFCLFGEEEQILCAHKNIMRILLLVAYFIDLYLYKKGHYKTCIPAIIILVLYCLSSFWNA